MGIPTKEIKIVSVKEFLNGKFQEKIIVKAMFFHEGKKVEKSSNLIGIWFPKLSLRTTSGFSSSSDPFLEENEEIKKEILKGGVFLRITENEIRCFIALESKILEKTFVKPEWKPWKVFYLETLSQLLQS